MVNTVTMVIVGTSPKDVGLWDPLQPAVFYGPGPDGGDPNKYPGYWMAICIMILGECGRCGLVGWNCFPQDIVP